MPYGDIDKQRAYLANYQSAENAWRPIVLKRDLSEPHIKALHVQAAIDDVTLSGVIARYMKEGLSKDGRIKVSAE